MLPDRVPDVPLRVCHLPPAQPAAADYVRLLTTALGQQGVRILSPGEGRGAWPALGEPPDVIHLHWLEFLATSEAGGPLDWLRSLLRHARLVLRLLGWRRRGTAVVWTVHNLDPHEPVRPRMERARSRMVLRIVNTAIAHSDYARSRIAAELGTDTRVTVIGHGNYEGVFPPAPASRAQVRSRLGIPVDAFVYLAFGQVRLYKQLVDLARSFGELDDPQARLLIAGRPVASAVAAQLRALAARDRRIVLDLRTIPDEEVCELHAGADAAVFAYRDVFSSGALLLALSLGLPVVVPERSAGAELGARPAVHMFAPGRLHDGLTSVRGAEPEAARRAARAIAGQFPWSRVASETISLYDRVTARRRT